MTIEKDINFRLYLITDRKQTLGRPLTEVVRRAVEAGVNSVQLREKDLNSRELRRLAEELREITAAADARLFINDRAEIAAAVGADGVHLTQNSFSPDHARKLLGEDRLIGKSTHSPQEAYVAQEEGADFITLGPVYPTPSKLKYGFPLGPAAISEAAQRVRIPILAIGGIKAHNIHETLDAGAHGVALISAIMAADDIEKAGTTILKIVETPSERQAAIGKSTPIQNLE